MNRTLKRQLDALSGSLSRFLSECDLGQLPDLKKAVTALSERLTYTHEAISAYESHLLGKYAEEEPSERLFECPGCGGPADNGHDRCIPPNPYFCTKCQ
jgi:hypothetical protein